MHTMTRKTCTLLAGIATLVACSAPEDAPAPPPTPAQIEAAAAAPQALDAEAMQSLHAMLQAQGKACAELVAARPLPEHNAVEATCIEHAGGTQRITHRVDLGAI